MHIVPSPWHTREAKSLKNGFIQGSNIHMEPGSGRYYVWMKLASYEIIMSDGDQGQLERECPNATNVRIAFNVLSQTKYLCWLDYDHRLPVLDPHTVITFTEQ